MLGDNLLYGPGLGTQLRRFNEIDGWRDLRLLGGRAFGIRSGRVRRRGDAWSRWRRSRNARSNYAVHGLYFYDNDVVEIARDLTPECARGEYEITDVNRTYLQQGRLQAQVLPRGTAWLDTGTFDQMTDAADYVRTMERRTGLKIGAPRKSPGGKGFSPTMSCAIARRVAAEIWLRRLPAGSVGQER